MLTRLSSSLLLLLATLTSHAAFANNFNYNFFEIRTALNPESFGESLIPILPKIRTSLAESIRVLRAIGMPPSEWGSMVQLILLPISMDKCSSTAHEAVVKKAIKTI